MSASAFSDLTSKRKGLPLAKGEDHTGARPDGMELRQGARRSVLVVQRRLPHYRVPYFEALRVELNRRGWDLRLAHGVGTAAEQIKNDSGSIAWAESLETRYLFGGRLCWQPFSHLICDAAMVVVTPENKLVNNIPLQFFRSDDVRVGLWGHGANLQGTTDSWRERFKRISAKRADWWFGYTDMSVPLILRTGFPADRITTLNNSVDTVELQTLKARTSRESLDSLRARIGLKGDAVGIYVGSLYEEKRIEFMLATAQQIHDKVPGFEFLVVGDGPQRSIVESFCAAHPWVTHLGIRKGQEKVDLIGLAKVMINPGLVGLSILDAFVLGTPMITTDCGLHSPEIAYLQDGVNGIMTANSAEAYASTVATILTDTAALDRLRAGCERSAAQYTIQNMAVNFANGVEACASQPIFRRHQANAVVGNDQ